MASSFKDALEPILKRDPIHFTQTATFPRRPLLDRVIVREIPLAEYYQQPEGITVDLENSHIRERSDRGEVVAVSRAVAIEGEVKVGDVVTYDEFVMCSPIFLNPADKNKPDLPKYWLIRLADLTSVLNA